MRQPINIAATNSHIYAFADDRTIWVWSAGKSEWEQMPGLPDAQDLAENPFVEQESKGMKAFEAAFDKEWALNRTGVWVKALKQNGAKIGPGNYRHWAQLVITYQQTRVERAVSATDPDKRWPGDVEKLLLKWARDGREDEAVF
jgi:hypothetical protein